MRKRHQTDILIPEDVETEVETEIGQKEIDMKEAIEIGAEEMMNM